MKIALCIKQVPDTADIKLTKDNTLDREGVESIINPFDYYAAEAALRIKDKNNAYITVISMGPIQAITALREIMAMGADDAFLLCDKRFAGSDTAATSKTLACAIKNKLNNIDLVFCGQCATDGDTAQTGPSLSQKLNFGLVTNVKEILEIQDDFLIVKKETDDGYEIVKVNFPSVICMLKSEYNVRLAKISGRIKAQNTKIAVYNADDTGVNSSETGIKGSPTYVKKAFRPQERQSCELISDKTAEESACLIVNKIYEYTKDTNGTI